MKKMNLLIYCLLSILLASCMGAGNEELDKATFGLVMNVTEGENQVLEDPESLAEDIQIQIVSEGDGDPSSGVSITFILDNPDSGAKLLSTAAVTDSEGYASTQVVGGNDFGVVANITIIANGTGLKEKVSVAIRDKIIPTKIQIVDPPSEVVAGVNFDLQLRLVDDNGRVSEEEDFNTEISVDFTSLSGDLADPARFSKTNANDRIVSFVKGKGVLSLVSHKTAEDVTISLRDHGKIPELEAITQRSMNISEVKVVRIVPATAVRMQLDNPDDATTDDTVEVLSRLYDQYDNFAYNYTSTCQARFDVVGDNGDEVWVSEAATPASREKYGVAIFSAGTGKLNIRDTKVENVTITISNLVAGCGGMTNLGSTQDVAFSVGAVQKIELRAPVPDTVKTTDEISLLLEATDAGGNFTSAYNGNVGILFDGSCSAFVNPADHDGTSKVFLAAGTKTIRVSNTNLDRKAIEECTVLLGSTASSTGLDLSSTQKIYFTPGDAKQFSFLANSYTGEVGWGTAAAQRNPTTIEVEARDTYGNPVSTYSGGDVSIVSDGNTEVSTTDADSGTNAKVISINSSGKGTVTVWNIKNETANLTLTAGPSDMRHTTANAENVDIETLGIYTASIYYKWGIPNYIEITEPVDGTVDSAISLTATAYDYGNNKVNDYGSASTPISDLEFESDSATAVLSGPIDFVNGEATINIQNTVEETVNINLAMRTGVTQFKNSQSQDIDITHATRANKDVYFKWGTINRKFVITDPADTNVDNNARLRVQVVDQYNNPVRDYGCSGGTTDVKLTVNGNSRITDSAVFDHTNLTNYSALPQVEYVDIKSQSGSCPIASPSDDASYGDLYVYNRSISPFAADFQTVGITMEDSDGTGYSLTPTGGVISVNFAPGSRTQYVIKDSVGTVDDSIKVPVQALDQFDNLVVNYTENDAVEFRWIAQNSADIDLDADDNPVTTTDNRAPGDLYIDFLSGDRGEGYIYLSDTVSESISVGLENKAGYDTSATATILFNSGVVTNFAIVPPSDPLTITTDDKVLFTAQALDQYGNVNTSYETDIKVAVNNSAGIVTNPSEVVPDNYTTVTNLNVDITSGEATFYVYDRVKETVTLSFIDEFGRTLTLPTTDVDFLHGNPVSVDIAKVGSTDINPPGSMSASVNADSPQVVRVEVRDVNGNIADTFSDDVNLVIRSGNAELYTNVPGQDDIPNTGVNQTRVVNIASGVGNLYLNTRAVGSVSLHLDDSVDSTGLTMIPAAGDAAVVANVSHGAAEKFAIILPSDIALTPGQLGSLPTAVYTGNTDSDVGVTVNSYDHYNNLATGFSGDVILNVTKNAEIDSSSIPALSTYVDTKNVKLAMVSGTASFDIYDYQVETGVSLSLNSNSGTNSAGLSTSHTRIVNFTFGAPSYFAIVKPLSNGIVDNPSSVTVEIRDQRHNVITNGFEGTVDFNVNGDAFLNDAADINSTTGLVASPLKTRTINFASGNNGVESIAVYDRTAELVTFSLSSASETAPGTSTPGVTDLKFPAELKNQTFDPGAAKDFQIQTPVTIDGDGNHVTADNALVVEVWAYDKYGNFKNNYTQADAIQLQLSLNGKVVGADGITAITDDKIDFGGSFPQGIGRITIRDLVAETIDLTLADHLSAGFTGNTVQVKVRHGEPVDFIITNALGRNDTADNPTFATRADVGIEVEVTARDAYTNTVENFAGKANLAFIAGLSGTSFPSGATISSWTDGVGKIIFNKTVVGDVTVEVQDHVDAPVMDNSDPLAQKTITIVHGLPNKYAFITPAGPIVAGDEIPVTIEAQDVHGNKALSYDGVGKDVQVEYRSGVGTFKDGASFVSGPKTYQFSSGAATVILKKETFAATSFPNTDETIQLGFLTASDGTLDVTDTESIIFTPDVAEELVVVIDPTLNTAGLGPFPIDNAVTLRVEARDQFGNYNDSYSGTVNAATDKDAWVFQDGTAWGAQNRTIKTANFSVTSGFVNIKVADLKAETNVNVTLDTPIGGSISTLTPTQIDFMHGVGTDYTLVFVDQPLVTIPEFSTDKERGLQVRVLDQGANIVLNHPNHDVRLTHNGVDSNFTGDFGGDEGRVTVTNGTADLSFDSRRIGNITLSIDPALYDTNLVRSTKTVKIVPGTVSQFVIVGSASFSADTLLISDAAFSQPACGAVVPGAAPCPKPTDILKIEPQDKYGNLNDIEGAGQVYEVSLEAKDTSTLQQRWIESLKVIEGKTYLADGTTLFNQQLIRAEGVQFTLSSPNPTTQIDEDGNTVTLDISSVLNSTVIPGQAAKVWVVQPTNGTIDNPIDITVEVQDGHDIDGNGNGNLVTTAPNMAVDFTLSSTSGLPVWNGLGTSDPRDTDTTDLISTDTITIKKGIGVFKLENTKAENVDIGLTAAPGGVTSRFDDGDNDIYYSVANQTKTVTFGAGVPHHYQIVPPAAGSLYDVAEGDNLKRFDFQILAYDQGNNFKNNVNGTVIIDVTNPNGDVTIYNSDESESGTNTYTATLVNGVANVSFTSTTSGVASLQLRKDTVTPDPVGIDVDPTVYNVNVNPGPVVKLKMVDPTDIKTTASTDISDAPDDAFLNTTAVVVRAYDFFDNFNNSFTGSVITLATDSSDMESVKVSDQSDSIDLAFSSGQASLLLRNRKAEVVNLSLTDTYSQFAGIDYTGADTLQDVEFTAGLVGQVSIEVAAASEDPSLTTVTTDTDTDFTIRTFDIYGNPNTVPAESTFSSEVNLYLTLESNSTGDFDNTPALTSKSQDITNGVGTFSVNLRKFSSDRFDAAAGRFLGAGSGMEKITVVIDSTANSFAYLNNVSSKTVYVKHGNAKYVTLEDPDPSVDKTTDDTVTVNLHTRDLYGNVDLLYGGSGESATLSVTGGNASVNSNGASDTVPFVNGVGTTTVTNTVVETVDLTVSAGTAPFSGTALAPPVSLDYVRTQDLAFAPGAPAGFLFADSKKSVGTIISTGNVGPVTMDSTPVRITVDNDAELYYYAVDAGGNIIPSVSSTDRVAISANNGATVNTADGVYGDFIGGEGKVVVSHTTSEVVRLSITKLLGADSSIVTNYIDVDFDHGLTDTFAWSIPLGKTIDTVATVSLEARDQFGNKNDNYAGQLTIAGFEAVTDPLVNQEPYLSSNSSDIDPSDNEHLQQAGGVLRNMTAGALSLDLMALRATQYNLSITAAEETADSNGSLSLTSDSLIFASGFPIQFEIYDFMDGAYNPYSSSGTINITSASDSTNLNTDKYARIGVQALDRGGNRAVSYNKANGVRIASSPATDIDFVVPGGTSWNAGGGNGVNSLVLNITSGLAELEMRSKNDTTYNLSLANMAESATEKNVGNKQITFAPGQFRKIFFPGSNVATVKADDTFQIDIEARDNFDNLAIDYTGYVRVGLETSPGTVEFPGDAGFPTGVVFPSGADGRDDGTIKLVNGVGTLAGFEGHTAGDTLKLVIVEDDFDFDQSGGLGATAFFHSVSVIAGDPARIVYDGTVNDVVVNNDAQVSLRIEDTYGNLCNTTDGTISLHVSGATYGDSDKKVSTAPTTGSAGANTSSSPGNTLSITNGVATYNIWTQRSDTITLTLSNPTVAGFSPIVPTPTQNFDFLPDSAQVVTFVQSDYLTDETAGGSQVGVDHMIYLTAFDQYGNISNHNGTVSLISSDPTKMDVKPVGTMTFSNGKASKALQTTITHTATLSLGSGGGLTTTDTYTATYTHGVAHHYAFANAVPTTVVGNNATVNIRVEDEFNNLCTTQDGSVGLVIDSQATADSNVKVGGSGGTASAASPTANTVTVSNGVATVQLYSEKADIVNLSLKESSFALTSGTPYPTSINFTYLPGNPVDLKWKASNYTTAKTSDSTTVGNAHTLYVVARDQYQNISSFNGTVDIQSDHTMDLQANGSMTFTDGKGTQVINTSVRNNSITLSFGTVSGAGSASITGTAQTYLLDYDHGPAESFTLELAPRGGGGNYTIDEIFNYNIKAVDAYGNVDDNYASSITVKTTQNSAVQNPFISGSANYLASGQAITLSAGSYTLPVETLDAGALTMRIQSATGVTDVGQTVTTTIDPGAVMYFEIQEPSVGKVSNPANTDLKVEMEVFALDKGNNKITSYNPGAAIGTLEVVSVASSDITKADLTTSSTYSVENGPYEQSIDVNTFINGVATLYVKSQTVADFDIDLNVTLGGTSLQGGAKRVRFDPGGTSKIVFSAPTTTNRADLTFDINLAAQDSFGNPTPSFTGAIKLKQASGIGCSIPTDTVTFSAGTGSYTSIQCTNASAITLGIENGAGSTVSDVSATAPITITHGRTNLQFYLMSISNIPVSNSVETDVEIQLRDQYGNAANTMTNSGSGFNVNLTATSDDNSQIIVDSSSMVAGVQTINIPDNTSSKIIKVYSTKAMTATFGLSDSGEGFSLNPGAGRTFDFIPGVASKLRMQTAAISQQTTDVYNLEIHALDEFDNVAPSFTNNISVIASDNDDLATGSTGVVPMTLGKGSINIQRTTPTAGSPVTFSLQPSGSLDITTSFVLTVTAGPVKKVVFENISTPVLSRTVDTTGIPISVTLQDLYGNPTKPVGGDSVDVDVAVISGPAATWNESGTGSTRITWTSGSNETQTINIVSQQVGTATLGFTGANPSSIDITHSIFLNFIHGAPTKYEFGSIPTDPGTDQTASIQVRLLDQYSNVCTTVGGATSVILNGSKVSGITGTIGGVGGSSPLASGVATFNVTSTTRQLISLSIQNDGTSYSLPSSENVNFVWGDPAKIGWQTLPTPVQVGNTWTVVAQIEDGNGNVLTEYSGNVNLDLSFSGTTLPDGSQPPSPSGGGVRGWSSGLASWNLSGNGAGNLTLTASESGVASANGLMVIEPDSPSKIFISTPGSSGIISQATTVSAILLDTFGNESKYNGNIDFVVRASQINTPTSTDGYHDIGGSPTTRSITFSNESQTSFNIRKSTHGYVNVIVTSPPGGMSMQNSQGIDFHFQPGDPVEYQLVLPAAPDASLFHSTVSAGDKASANAASGVPITVAVNAVDVTGSIATTWGGVVKVMVSGNGRLISSELVSLTGGAGTFEMFNEYAEDVTITLEDQSSDNLKDGTANGACTGFNECSKTVVVKRSRAKEVVLTSNVSSIRAYSNSGQDRVTYTATVKDESGATFTNYRGDMYAPGCYGYLSGNKIEVRSGVGTKQCWDRYQRTITMSLQPDQTYSGSLPITMDSLAVNTIHNTPTRAYLYCPDDSVAATDEVEKCYFRLNDSYGDNSAGYLGNNVKDSDGFTIDIDLFENDGTTSNASATFYTDVDDDGILDPEDTATGVAASGVIDLTGTDGQRNFFINSSQEEFVVIDMSNQQYTGGTWTAGQISAINHLNTQTVYFTPAETTEIALTVTESPAAPNPTQDNSEYFRATVTAKTASGAVSTAEDGYIYVDIITTGVADPINTSEIYLDKNGAGSFSQETTELVQFVNGVAYIDIASRVTGDFKIRMRDPGTSGWTFTDNNQEKSFVPNPATKFINQGVASTRYSDNTTQTIDVYATDANGNIDTNFSNSVNVTFTLSAADKRSKITNLVGNQIAFSNGVATLNVVTDEPGSYSLTVGPYTGVTADTDSYTFSAPDPDEIIRTDSNSVVAGAVTIDVRAQKSNGVLASSFNGFYNITYKINGSGTTISDGSMDGSSTNVALSSGIGQINLKSKKSQVVDIEFSEVFTSGPSPTFATLTVTFTTGAPTQIAITQQPVGDVLVDENLSTSLIVTLKDADGNTVTDASNTIELEGHIGSSCGSLDSTNFSYGGSQTPTSGVITFASIQSSQAQAMSIKIKDSAGSLSTSCTNVVNIYDDLVGTLEGTAIVNTGDTRIIELTGGVPSLSLQAISTSTDSTAVLVTSSEPGCDVAQCVKYTAGKQMSTDTVTVDDSGGNSVSTVFTLQAPSFDFLNADSGDSALGDPHDLGQITNSGTYSRTVKIKNIGNSSSGALALSLSEDNGNMWSMSDIDCVSSNLAINGECTVSVNFHADSSEAAGSYSATLEVKGVNDTGVKTIAIDGEKLPALEMLNSSNVALGDPENMGAFDSTSDNTMIIRIKQSSSAPINSGNITVNLTPDFADMWTITADGCSGQDLSAGSTCDMTLSFNSNSGVQGAGAYSANIQVSSPNTGSQDIDIQATKNP